MENMQFLSENELNTTTMVTVDSGTATAQYLFDRNIELGYSSSGYNSTTSTVIKVTFAETTSVSHILLQNHNLRQFRCFYDSLTANSILATSTNSATSTYISFSTISAISIHLQMDNTIDGSEERSVGEFVIGERKLLLPQNPNAKLFTPEIVRTQIEHQMPDGGVVLFNIKDKYKAIIELNYISTSFYSNLLTVYNLASPLYFVPFATSTAWDGKAYCILWTGGFNFKNDVNTRDTYSGSIILKETFSG